MPTSRRLGLALVLAAVGLAGLIYLPTLRHEFVWDDDALITTNPDITRPCPFPLLGRSFLQAHAETRERPDHYYRPLVIAGFWLDYRLWGYSPAGWHLTNIVLNLVACLLAALLLWRLFDRRTWPALLGGLAFALHPAHVESVAFVAGRTDLLAAVFSLAALLLIARDRAHWWTDALGFVAFALALVSKEVVVLLPTVLFLACWRGDRARLRRALAVAGIGLALVAGYLLLRWSVLGGFAPTATGTGIAPGRRLMLIANALGRYGLLTLLPFHHRLQYPDAAEFARFGWPTLAGATLAAGLAFKTWRWRARPLGLGAALFLALILPVANLFPMGFSLLAERLLYLPVLGAVIIAADAAVSLRSRAARRALAVAGLALVALFAFDGLRRLPVWRDNLSLFRRMVAESPGSADARFNLGLELRESGDTAAALPELRLAASLNPGHARAHLSLGEIYKARGDDARALEHYRQAVAASPHGVEAHNGLGMLHARAGRLDSALARFRAVLELRPLQEETWVNIGNTFALLGMPDSAAHAFRRAIDIRPDLPQAWSNLERLYRSLGMADSADAVRARRPKD